MNRNTKKHNNDSAHLSVSCYSCTETATIPLKGPSRPRHRPSQSFVSLTPSWWPARLCDPPLSMLTQPVRAILSKAPGLRTWKEITYIARNVLSHHVAFQQMSALSLERIASRLTDRTIVTGGEVNGFPTAILGYDIASISSQSTLARKRSRLFPPPHAKILGSGRDHFFPSQVTTKGGLRCDAHEQISYHLSHPQHI